MKSFIYNAKGILSFSHSDKDYVVNGDGPHSLPEESPLIESLVKQGILTEKESKKTLNTINK